MLFACVQCRLKGALPPSGNMLAHAGRPSGASTVSCPPCKVHLGTALFPGRPGTCDPTEPQHLDRLGRTGTCLFYQKDAASQPAWPALRVVAGKQHTGTCVLQQSRTETCARPRLQGRDACAGCQVGQADSQVCGELPRGVGMCYTLRELLRRHDSCLLYTSPSPRDRTRSRMPSSA